METENILVKYCFSELKEEISDDKVSYYSSIISKLEREGVIQNICTYRNEALSLFHGEEIEMNYQIEDRDKYTYSFSCKEIREGKSYDFDFTVKFLYETHDLGAILYVEIFSKNYTFSDVTESNCLEVLKHKLRSNIKGWKNRYCLIDKQSAFYASKLYPLIHEIENFFRYYVNDVFIKIFGPDWWNRAIATSIKKNRQSRIEDTREYAGAYRDIQPYLLSLELGDLMTIAHTKQLKWVPRYNNKIENILNHQSVQDLIPLLKEQCEVNIDIWAMCFEKHFSEKFAANYNLFEKRRNQVAHNKLLDYESYRNISSLCNDVMSELVAAHEKFCLEFISEEERERIEEYKAYLDFQREEEIKNSRAFAEEESGVKVYTYNQIVELFNDSLLSLYDELIQIYSDRLDIEFGEYEKIEHVEANQCCFTLKHLIKDLNIYINAELDINDSQGDTSVLIVAINMGAKSKKWNIDFTNGKYSFDHEQASYMPEVKDWLDDASIEETKQGICDFIEENFPNLREEADIHNHLNAMGKTAAITERDVYCWDCGEEYICIDNEYAPIGTCLNCGAKNHIIYCTYCQCPIEAEEITDENQMQQYCSYCEGKLFGKD